jgi:pyruvate/2-oxoglutarate/acetoin dehydrogenase E1 component
MQTARALEQEGIGVEVIDVRTLVPLDEQTIFASVRKTGRLVIAEEDNLTGGWGAEVAARVAEHCIDSLDAPIRRVAAPDTPVPFAPAMETFYVPSVQRIVDTLRSVL